MLIALLMALVQPLWPEGKIPDFQEHQIAAMSDVSGRYEQGQPLAGFDPAAHRMPYLDWHEAPANPNGGCMVLVSGGSYQRCCDVGLVNQWREQLTALGFQCVNLVYRTPRPQGLPIYQSAWEDGQRAIRLVRAAAKARGFDAEKIGLIGMSAGSHLAVMLATSALTPAYAKVDEFDELPCHLNWAIANAPAYSTVNGANGEATPQDGVTVVPAINPCFKFDAKTCPISFHHGANDPYSPNGSTLCYRELRKRKIPAELHLFADCEHGAFGFERAVEFMRQLGRLGPLGRPVSYDHRYFPHATLRTEKELLWPAGKTPDPSANQQYEPYLIWYLPERPVTKAIQVIFPGGAYSFCSMNNEGTPSAYYFNSRGMAAVVVCYRCPRPLGRAKHVSAWQDAQRAIRKVRAEAPARGLDPDRIGVMGFSAGGHLTLMAATSSLTPAYAPVDELDKLSCSVQWAFPVYPAYALTDGAEKPNVAGGNEDDSVLVGEFAFDAATPPMCFNHGDADDWAAMNSVKCWEKLRSLGIQCDLHTYATRGHCFHVDACDGTGSAVFYDRLWDFLVRKGLNR